MKRGLMGILLGAALIMGLNTGVLAAQPKLVASSLSDRYHLSTCKVVQKIRKEDLIEFKTPEEAIAAGLNPCKKCNPPTSSTPSDK